MNTSRLTAGASRFAHFAGLTRRGRRAADDDQTDTDASEEGDDDDTSAEDDDDQPQGKKGKAKKGKAKRAEDDDTDTDASEEGDDDDASADDDDDAESEPKGKRSRRASDEDDDDDQDEMTGKSASAKARRREQARIAHILGHKAAANNPVLAVSLACDTRMTRREAVRVLQTQPQGSAEEPGQNRHARGDRTSRNTSLGSDASSPSGKQAAASSWDRAYSAIGIPPRKA